MLSFAVDLHLLNFKVLLLVYETGFSACIFNTPEGNKLTNQALAFATQTCKKAEAIVGSF